MAGNTVTVTLEGKGANLQAALDRARSGFGHLERAAHSASGVISRALSTAYGVVLGNTVTSAFKSLESAAESFGQKVIDSSIEAADAQRFLKSAVEETRGSFGQALADAESLGKALGVSRSEAERLLATAKVGLRGTVFDAGKFLRAAADLSASRGIRPGELDTIITQIFNGADEGLGKLFSGRNPPSSFFNDWARAAGRTAESLTDLERKTILVNAVIQAGAKHTGLATDRLGSLGGRLDAIGALVTDVAAKVGDALQRNVGIAKLIEGASTALGKLSTDQGAVDALLTKIAEGFVTVGNRVLDFAQIAARGFNGFIGSVQKMSIAAKQVLLDLEITFQEFWQALQFQAASALQPILGSLKVFADVAIRGVADALKGIIGLVRPAVTAAAARGLPGASEIDEALGNFQKLLSGSDDFAARVGQTFDTAIGSIDGWIAGLQKSHEGTERLKDQLAQLGHGYAEIDRATAAANKTTDAFFDSLRPKLGDFAKFNAPAEATTITTKLVEEGDSLTGFPVIVAAQSEAAKAQTKAVRDMNTKLDDVLGAMVELGGGIGPLEGAIVGLKQSVDRGAILKVIRGSDISIDVVAPAVGNVP